MVAKEDFSITPPSLDLMDYPVWTLGLTSTLIRLPAHFLAQHFVNGQEVTAKTTVRGEGSVASDRGPPTACPLGSAQRGVTFQAAWNQLFSVLTTYQISFQPVKFPKVLCSSYLFENFLQS